jgi:hypothetical protein
MNNRKLLASVIFIALAILTLTACSGSPGPQEKEVLKLLTNYKKMQMEVTDYRQKPDYEETLEEARAFFTEKGLEERAIDGQLFLYKKLAYSNKRNIELGEITLEEMDSEKFDYAYKVTIRSINEQGDVVHEHQVSGQIKLVKRDGSWLIDKEWSRVPRAAFFE